MATIVPASRAEGRRERLVASGDPSDTPCVLSEHPTHSGRRAEVEAFIRAEFRRHFGATLKELMPALVTLHGDDGELRAAAGYRGAASGRLFLETYTQRPIEAVISERLAIEVPRERIVEVGNFACHGRGAAVDMVRALVPALCHAGFSWVVFTGADTVRNVFSRLGLAPIPLCAAEGSLLGNARHDWGTYYDHQPVVMAGRIADGMRALRSLAGVQR